MESHLKSLGWPSVPNADQLVLNEVENMFRLLLKQNLVSYGDYEQFYLAAISSYERAQLRKAGFNV
jgi:hypothetical protein